MDPRVSQLSLRARMSHVKKAEGIAACNLLYRRRANFVEYVDEKVVVLCVVR